MKRLSVSLIALAVAACAANMGAPSEISMPTAALRADANATPTQAAAAIRSASARAALVVGPHDEAWFRELAAASGLELSGPGAAGDIGLGFLAMEALGDTTIELSYPGGRFTVQDALYAPEDERYLDLLAFRVDRPDHARPIIASLLEYAATDVMPSAAVVLAVAVPSAEVGDSVAVMLSPGYYDALRCGEVAAPASQGDRLRLFYGPEARIFCRSASVQSTGAGELTTARLVMGRR